MGDGYDVKALRSPRCTEEELEERVDFVAGMLAKCAKTGEIKRAVAKRFDVGHRAAGDYIARAKKLLAERIAISREQGKDLALGFLLDVIEKEPTRYALVAEQRLSEILGYNAPKQMEVSGRDGQPLEYRNMTPEERRARLDEIFGRSVTPANGEALIKLDNQ